MALKPIQLTIESIKPATTSETTRAIVYYLNKSGCVAWRQNNAGIWDEKRKRYIQNPLSKKGVSDIMGYRKSDGKAIYVEVKTGKDKLSQHQKDFLLQAHKNNCIVIVAKTFEDFEKKWLRIKIKIS